MFVDMALEDACDIGLGLGLGSHKGRIINGSKSNGPSMKPCFKFENLVPSAPTSSELSLALALSDEGYQIIGKVEMNRICEDAANVNHRPASPHSTVSSLSNTREKRWREVASEEMELERVCWRVSDEDEESNVRKKLRLTKEQSALLEDSFKEHTTLNPKQKQALAKQLNLRPRQVEVWFQNRRARTKLKQTEVDCEFLKKCCETLTEENRRLYKELQDLKALKLAQPMYMKLPAATLTMCPSCERISGGGIDTSKESFPVPSKPQLYRTFTHPSAAC